MANYTQRREAWITAGIDAGIDIGTQRMADLMALALNDPEVMGKGVLGVDRIKKVYAKIQELQHDLSKAWLKCDEQDYQQARLDRELRRIFGGEFVPFSERYPDVKKPK